MYAIRSYYASTVRDISIKLRSEGVTTFFPTLITNSADNILRSVKAIAEACRIYPEAAGAVGGIHLEGPFISAEDGARGAHPREYTRPPDCVITSYSIHYTKLYES